MELPEKIRNQLGVRTMLEFLMELPTEIAVIAIKEADRQAQGKAWKMALPKVQLASWCLSAAFKWHLSEDGEAYWKHVHTKLLEWESKNSI
jgi:hypothetical protein